MKKFFWASSFPSYWCAQFHRANISQLFILLLMDSQAGPTSLLLLKVLRQVSDSSCFETHVFCTMECIRVELLGYYETYRLKFWRNGQHVLLWCNFQGVCPYSFWLREAKVTVCFAVRDARVFRMLMVLFICLHPQHFLIPGFGKRVLLHSMATDTVLVPGFYFVSGALHSLPLFLH